MACYTKADLKALMREKMAEKSTRIDSPLAEYDSNGQLKCRVCLTHQKEASWAAHLLSQPHKESLDKLKRKSKKDHTVQPAKACKRSQEKSSIGTETAVCSLVQDPEKLKVVDLTYEDKEHEERVESRQIELPTGFFDDPVRDARERNVEYKDPVEEEWKKFQTVMSGEANRADILVQDEHEENQKDTTLEEIDRQLSSWSKIDQLQKKIDDLRSNKSKPCKKRECEKEFKCESDDEEDHFNLLLDWRSKQNRI